jgi:SAM-dependent methyltransferase
MIRTATARQERTAAVFDSDVWPLLPERAARLILAGLAELPTRGMKLALEVGCATGGLSLEVARRLGADARLIALDESPALIARAESRRDAHQAAREHRPGGKGSHSASPSSSASRPEALAEPDTGARVSFQVGGLRPPFPAADGTCDLVYSNLALAESLSTAAAHASPSPPSPPPLPTSAKRSRTKSSTTSVAPVRSPGGPAAPSSALRADVRAGLGQLASCLAPGGALLATFPVEGCWREFLDLYADVLTAQGRRETLAALQEYRRGFPRPATLATALEGTGLIDVTVETARWELLFKSAREFFFAPVVELGPLGEWQQIAGGRGDEMQDLFFFVKEAIDTYFARTPFGVSLVVCCVKGRRP